MTYAETLAYLYDALPMFSRTGPAAYKKDLTNIRLLCDKIGNPQKTFKTIHVGGTNGKGSVSHMLAAVFQTAGYKTGLYTSPHLYDFRERIRLNGEMVSEEFVTRFTQSILPYLSEIQPSFFEVTVAMAFQFFAEQKVDVAIVEVGLGGRLDSTNIITPELSIITNIGWDHTAILGDTLPKIAVEKAGIIKQNIPVVIGETQTDTTPVFQQVALNCGAPISWAEEEFELLQTDVQGNIRQLFYRKQNGENYSVKTDLAGIYQTKNVRTVLCGVEQLRKSFDLPDGPVRAALANVKALTGLRGRWDVIGSEPMIVLDVAHNREGMQQLLLQVEHTPYRKLHIVFGTVKDKDAGALLELLPRNAAYYFTQAQIPRALPAAELAELAAKFQIRGGVFDGPSTALDAAKRAAAAKDLIVVCGSIFVVAEIDPDQNVNAPSFSKA